jgi:hypothetical protein
LIFPDSPDYDKARRLSNPRFDLRPALIACCACDSDVRICLRLVGVFSVPFRIRAGGHSVMGYSEVDDGVLIDLSGLNDMSVDPILRTIFLRRYRATTLGRYPGRPTSPGPCLDRSSPKRPRTADPVACGPWCAPGSTVGG